MRAKVASLVAAPALTMPLPVASDRVSLMLQAFACEPDPAVLGEVFTDALVPLVRAAMRVVRDRGLADDAVQDAFLALLHGEARFDGRRAALPWLRGLVTNKARRLRRRRALVRRAEVDGVALDVPGRATEPAGDQAQRLRAALRALPTPYREVVRRRYFGDEASGAIARDLAIVDATVRARLRRGLAMLRSRLQALLGVLLALLLGGRARAAQVGLVGVVLLTAGLWSGPPAPAAASSATTAPASDDEAPSVAAEATASPSSRPGEYERSALAAVAAEPGDVASLQALRLVFADRSPAAHVGLRTSVAGVDFELGVERAVTDATGLVLLRAGTTWRTDRGAVVTVPTRPGECVEVPLAIDAGSRTVEVAAMDGTAPAAALVWVSDGPGAFDGAIVGTADASGRLTLRGLAPGTHVAALLPGAGASPVAPIGSDATVRCRLSSPCRVVRGVVVDVDGRPIRGARVRMPGGASDTLVLPGNLTMAPPPGAAAVTGPDGTFTAFVIDERPLLVRASGHGCCVVNAPMDEHARIVMHPGAQLRGTVRGPDGAPARGARVLVRGQDWWDRCGTFADGEGRFEFDSLAPGTVALEVHAAECAVFARTAEVAVGAAADIACTLVAREQLRVRVATADGSALRGVEAAVRTHGTRPAFVHRADSTGALALDLPRSADELVMRRSARSPWVSLPLHAAAGQEPIDASRLGTARVAIRVIDAAGNTIPLAGVACRDALGISVLSCERDGDRWVTGLLPVGDHELSWLAATEGTVPVTRRVPGLEVGETRDLGIVQAESAVARRVRIVGECADDEVLFVLRDPCGNLASTSIGRGLCVVRVAAGNWRLSMFGRDSEWLCDVPVGAAPDDADVQVVLRAGRRRTVLVDGAIAGDRGRLVVRRGDVERRVVFGDDVAADEIGVVRRDIVLGDGVFEVELETSAGTLRGRFTLDATMSSAHVAATSLRR